MEARQLPRIGRGSEVPCTLAGFQCRERVEEEEEEARAIEWYFGIWPHTNVYGTRPLSLFLGCQRPRESATPSCVRILNPRL